MQRTACLLFVVGSLAGSMLVGCQEYPSSNAPAPSAIERTPQERLQLVVDEIARQMQPVDEIQTLGERQLRIQYLVEEISDPVFHEPENKTDPLTAEITIRTQSVVTSLDLGIHSNNNRSPDTKTDQPDRAASNDRERSSENGESALSKVVRDEVAQKHRSQTTENSETLVFQFQDGKWNLTSEDVSEAILGDVNTALELQ